MAEERSASEGGAHTGPAPGGREVLTLAQRAAPLQRGSARADQPRL